MELKGLFGKAVRFRVATFQHAVLELLDNTAMNLTGSRLAPRFKLIPDLG